MKQSSLTRRLLAGAAGLTIGVTGAVAFATPAYATWNDEHSGHSPFKSLSVTGTAVCDEETGDSTVEWAVTNTSFVDIDAEITNVVADGDIEGDIALGTILSKGAQAAGTQVFPAGTESASLEVELTWTWKELERVWVPNFWGWGGKHEWQWVDKSKSKTETAEVDLTECDVPPPPPPPNPPNVILLASCDDLVFIVDNVGDAEAAVELAPNTTVAYGPASGFSYSIDEESGEVEPIVDEDASIDFSEEADESNPASVGPLAPGADPVALGFEGSEGLTVTIGMTLNGEAVEFDEGENVVSFDDEVADLDCDEGGEGGELPVTGANTGFIALAAVVLLAVGGGLFLVARRRRVTFTA